MSRIVLLFLLPAIACATESPRCVAAVSRALFLNGSGPIVTSLCIEHKHGHAKVTMTARNHTGWPVDARFCVRSKKHTDCAFEFWTTETWDPADPLEVSHTGPWQSGLKEPDIVLEWLQRIVPKLETVARVYVAEIDGDAGEMARDQIIATLANNSRFQVVNSDELADAVIVGRAELRTGPTITSGSAEGRETGIGSIGGLGSRRTALVGGIATGHTKEKSTSSTLTVTERALVLHVVLRSGETVWGWDDTTSCDSDLKTRCAIRDLVAVAGRYSPKP
jgi:hypothetical protein